MTRPQHIQEPQASNGNFIHDRTNDFDAIISQLESTDNLALGGKFKTYVTVKVGDLKGVAILDSGTNWRTAISPFYARKLGLNLITDLVPIKGMSSVGTAK